MEELLLGWFCGVLVVWGLMLLDFVYHALRKMDYEMSLGIFTLFSVCSWLSVLAVAIVIAFVILVLLMEGIGTFFSWLFTLDIWSEGISVTFNNNNK